MSEEKKTDEKATQPEKEEKAAEKKELPASMRKPGQNYSTPKFNK